MWKLAALDDFFKQIVINRDMMETFKLHKLLLSSLKTELHEYCYPNNLPIFF